MQGLFKYGVEQRVNILLHSVETLVEVQRPDDRLTRRREIGCAVATAALLLTAAEQQRGGNALLCKPRQRFSTDERRTETGQPPFGRFREAVVEHLRAEEAEHGIAQELKPLVILKHILGVLAGIGRMGQRADQQRLIAKLQPDSLLQFCWIGICHVPASARLPTSRRT